LLLASGILVLGQEASSDARLSDVIKEILGTMDKLTSHLEGIKDEDTAKASRAELKKVAAQWIETRKKAEKVKPPSKEEKERLEKEYKEKLQTAQKKLLAEIARVKGVPGGPEALKEIRALMGKNSK
jgi:hypothetical protein